MRPRRRRHYRIDDEIEQAVAVLPPELATPEALGRGLDIARAVLVHGQSISTAARTAGVEYEAATALLIEARRALDGAIAADHLLD